MIMLNRFEKLTGKRTSEPVPIPVEPPPENFAGPQAEIDPKLRALIDIKVRLHQKLLDEIDLTAIDKLPKTAFQDQVAAMIRDLLRTERMQLNQQEQAQLTVEIIDEMIGLGPLEPLLKDPTVNDILVNTHRMVFVERAGKLELTGASFQDERHLLRIVNKIVAKVGRRVDES